MNCCEKVCTSLKKSEDWILQDYRISFSLVIYNALSSALASKYWMKSKCTFLYRFSYCLLPFFQIFQHLSLVHSWSITLFFFFILEVSAFIKVTKIQYLKPRNALCYSTKISYITLKLSVDKIFWESQNRFLSRVFFF